MASFPLLVVLIVSIISKVISKENRRQRACNEKHAESTDKNKKRMGNVCGKICLGLKQDVPCTWEITYGTCLQPWLAKCPEQCGLYILLHTSEKTLLHIINIFILTPYWWDRRQWQGKIILERRTVGCSTIGATFYAIYYIVYLHSLPWDMPKY